MRTQRRNPEKTPRDKQLGIRVQGELYRRLKLAALQQERPVTHLLEDAIEAYLKREG